MVKFSKNLGGAAALPAPRFLRACFDLHSSGKPFQAFSLQFANMRHQDFSHPFSINTAEFFGSILGIWKYFLG